MEPPCEKPHDLKPHAGEPCAGTLVDSATGAHPQPSAEVLDMQEKKPSELPQQLFILAKAQASWSGEELTDSCVFKSPNHRVREHKNDCYFIRLSFGLAFSIAIDD